MKYKTLNDDEVFELYNAIILNGYFLEDFCFSEEVPDIKMMPSSTSPRSAIIIKNTKTGKQKAYPSGVGSPWLLDFASDLKNGFFN